MDIDENGYWKPHVTNSSALLVPKISKFHIPYKVDCCLQVIKAFDLKQTCGAELEFITKNPQTFLN